MKTFRIYYTVEEWYQEVNAETKEDAIKKFRIGEDVTPPTYIGAVSQDSTITYIEEIQNESESN